MSDLYITRHAISRYRERVADVPPAAIWRALDCPAVRIAIQLGARYVRLSGGQRAVLQENRVITILPRDHHANLLRRDRDAEYDSNGEANAQG
ncbi:hypothetical protein [Erythrobacter sp.]|uniref:hypothetical protein n=1 Tax=Erythrobacter sp. TaxID=1042 RepID=UPI0025E19B73|nr:hypothetical protein [Erythrobacter sp.]